MSKWIRKIFANDTKEKRSKPVTKPQRKIGINKNYNPGIWQKNRFKQIGSS